MRPGGRCGWVRRRAFGDGKQKLDFHTILKSCYFADKKSLVERRRPIFGAEYIAMQYGPVPVEIYEMLKCEPKWLMEMAERKIEEYPWKPENHFVLPKIKGQSEEVECRSIARVEMNIVEQAFGKSSNMNFTQRTRETHEEDWCKGARRPGRIMHYEDMIPEDLFERDALIRDFEEEGLNYVL